MDIHRLRFLWKQERVGGGVEGVAFARGLYYRRAVFLWEVWRGGRKRVNPPRRKRDYYISRRFIGTCWRACCIYVLVFFLFLAAVLRCVHVLKSMERILNILTILQRR